MKVLLPWEILREEEDYLSKNLSMHEIKIVKTKDPDQVIKGINLSDIEVIIAGLADQTIINRAKKLKLVQSMISGVSHVDLDAAERKGVIVCSVKGANAQSVSEHGLMLMLNLLKNYKKYVYQGDGRIWEKMYSQDLAKKTVGIIGLGNIGTGIARLTKSFGANIVGIRNRPHLGSNGLDLGYLGGKDDLIKILAISDIAVLSVPKTELTKELINKRNLRYMKERSYLINISRGAVLNYEDVYDSLRKGKLSGFATDVFPTEPNDFSFPLYRMENVIYTPHVAAYTSESKMNCLKKVVDNINRFAAGKRLENVIDYELGY